MFGTHAPSVVLSESLAELDRYLPGVVDGSEDAVHQARVSMRRVREAISLARAEFVQDELRAIEERLTRARRALSRARDADVALRLVQKVEERFALAPHALGHLRAAVTADQMKARRKAVKKIEGLDLASLPQQFARARRDGFMRLAGRNAWRVALRQQIESRAAGVRAAINRAGGVYFPNRVHTARVAIKRLRYTLELADLIGLWRAGPTFRVLKKVQDALGEAHDRQLLLVRLEDIRESGAKLDPQEVEALEQFIRGEILALHAKYIARRAEVLSLCDTSAPGRRDASSGKKALLTAGLALPSLLLLRRSISTGVAEPEDKKALPVLHKREAH